jgi:hypothetical protein
MHLITLSGLMLDAALSLHSSPESRAGGEAKVRTPSKSGDADNIQ